MNLVATGAAAGGGWGIMIAYIVIFGAFMYFVAIRPQKKEQKRLAEMHADMAVGERQLVTVQNKIKHLMLSL